MVQYGSGITPFTQYFKLRKLFSGWWTKTMDKW